MEEAEMLNAQVDEEYPYLRKYPTRVDDQRQKAFPAQDFTGRDVRPPGKSEYFGRNEPNNPYPGERTVQLYDPDYTGDKLKNLLFGERFHALGQEDKGWIEKKRRFYELLPDWDKQMLRDKHGQMALPQDQRTNEKIKEAYPDYVEDRPYEEWLDQSEMDQWMGALINPPNDEWEKVRWSPDHKRLREEMLQYLRTPVR